MPFQKVDIEKEIQEKIKNDPEFAEAYKLITKQYEPIENAIKLRKEKEERNITTRG